MAPAQGTQRARPSPVPRQSAAPEPAPKLEQDPNRRLAVWVAAAAAVVGILLGFLASSLVSTRAPVYTSTAKLLINQPQALSLADSDGIVLKLSRLRLKYVGLVGTPVIDDRVALRMKRPPTALGGTLDAIAPPQNLNINVIGSSTTAASAQSLAQLGAEELAAYATREQITDRIPPNERFVLTVIAPAAKAALPAGSGTRAKLVGAAVGALAAVAVAGAAYARRRRVALGG
jgi:hypothetical protein